MPQIKKFRQNFTEVKTSTVFKWTLYDIPTCNKKEGESIASQIFLNSTTNASFNNEAKWQFKLFPKGCNEGCKTKLCIALQSLNDFVVKVEGELCIEPCDIFFKEDTFRHVFEGSTLQHGFIKHLDRSSCFINQEELNNKLRITCKMFLIEDKTFINNPQESLLEDICSLLHMKNNCDVILISSEGSEHKAHKAILSCRCPVFLAMFEHDLRKKQTDLFKITVHENSKTLKQMLEFIYTGKVKNIEYDEAKKLAIAADKYLLIALKNICVDYLYENMNIDNAMEIYDFACTHNLRFLKMDAERYFSKYKKQIMLSKGLEYIKSFSHNTIADLLYSSAVR